MTLEEQLDEDIRLGIDLEKNDEFELTEEEEKLIERLKGMITNEKILATIEEGSIEEKLSKKQADDLFEGAVLYKEKIESDPSLEQDPVLIDLTERIIDQLPIPEEI